jgi:hypothetical protein
MRRRSRKPLVTLSLFPFLAVLVCTMGALIVLLVLVVQQARVDASVAVVTAPPVDTEKQQELEHQREDFTWRREVLQTQRESLMKNLEQRRLQLSHLEDHIRRLEDRWRQLQAEADGLQAVQNAGLTRQQSSADELGELQSQLAQSREQLAKAKAEAAARPRSFAIIPYDGPNGTRRRPIYVECTKAGIILQPEGLVLTPADFDGPLGPGNPLDASLRAIREHWVRHGGTQGGSEPYPLLIVRPDGAVAYSVARAAMKSWEDAFGYELIDADMQLAFPPSDPVLAELLQQTVRDARQRQQMLAAAMPSQFSRGNGGSGSRGTTHGGAGGEGFIVASRSGGFERVGGGPDSPRGPGRGGLPSSGSRRGSGRSPVNAAATGRSGSGSGSSDRSPSSLAPNQLDNQPDAVTAAQGTRARPPRPNERTSDAPTAAGNAPANAAYDSRQASAGARAANGNPSANASSAAGTQAAEAGGGNGGAGGGGYDAMPAQATLPESVAVERGRDWALPATARKATGISRPIHIVCWSDRLIMMPDDGDAQAAQTFVIKRELIDELDTFVDAIWARTDDWGLAVLGGYWKPILHIEVAPGGEPRFHELAALMADSGLEVQKKSW